MLVDVRLNKIINLNLLVTVMALLTWSTPSFCPLTFGQGSSLKALDRTPENLAKTIAAVEEATVGDKDPGIKVLIKHYNSGATKAALLEKLRAERAKLTDGASEPEAKDVATPVAEAAPVAPEIPASGTAAADAERFAADLQAARTAEAAVVAAAVAVAGAAEARVAADEQVLAAEGEGAVAASPGAGRTAGQLTFGQGSSLKALDANQASNLDKVIAAVAAAAGDKDPGIKVLMKHYGSGATKAALLEKLRAARAKLTGGAPEAKDNVAAPAPIAVPVAAPAPVVPVVTVAPASVAVPEIIVPAPASVIAPKPGVPAAPGAAPRPGVPAAPVAAPKPGVPAAPGAGIPKPGVPVAPPRAPKPAAPIAAAPVVLAVPKIETLGAMEKELGVTGLPWIDYALLKVLNDPNVAQRIKNLVSKELVDFLRSALVPGETVTLKPDGQPALDEAGEPIVIRTIATTSSEHLKKFLAGGLSFSPGPGAPQRVVTPNFSPAGLVQYISELQAQMLAGGYGLVPANRALLEKKSLELKKYQVTAGQPAVKPDTDPSSYVFEPAKAKPAGAAKSTSGGGSGGGGGAAEVSLAAAAAAAELQAAKDYVMEIFAKDLKKTLAPEVVTKLDEYIAKFNKKIGQVGSQDIEIRFNNWLRQHKLSTTSAASTASAGASGGVTESKDDAESEAELKAKADKIFDGIKTNLTKIYEDADQTWDDYNGPDYGYDDDDEYKENFIKQKLAAIQANGQTLKQLYQAQMDKYAPYFSGPVLADFKINQRRASMGEKSIWSWYKPKADSASVSATPASVSPAEVAAAAPVAAVSEVAPTPTTAPVAAVTPDGSTGTNSADNSAGASGPVTMTETPPAGIAAPIASASVVVPVAAAPAPVVTVAVTPEVARRITWLEDKIAPLLAKQANLAAQSKNLPAFEQKNLEKYTTELATLKPV